MGKHAKAQMFSILQFKSISKLEFSEFENHFENVILSLPYHILHPSSYTYVYTSA